MQTATSGAHQPPDGVVGRTPGPSYRLTVHCAREQLDGAAVLKQNCL